MNRGFAYAFAGVAVAALIGTAAPSWSQLSSGSTIFVNGETQFLYTNSIGMKFVEIPAGSFIMGHYQPGCPEKTPVLPRRGRGGGTPPAAGRAGGAAAAAPAGTPAAAAVGGRAGAATPGTPTAAQTPTTAAPAAGRAGAPAATGAPAAGARAGAAPQAGRGLVWTDAQYALCQTRADAAYRPGFIVSIKQGYLLGQYEVTQAQYQQVMGVNPSYWQGDRVPAGMDPSNNPVDSVSWEDAQAFVAKLNALEGKDLYWLPTEAQWEWAARAGQEWTGLWSALDARASQYGWFGSLNFSDPRTVHTRPVGGKLANPWGLYDVLGNVWEWTADVYNNQYLASPTPVRGTNHVIKGGSFLDEAHSTTVFDHQGGPGSVKNVGFRVARKLVP